MKVKKALKRLARAEAILSELLNQFPAIEDHVRASLSQASALLVLARESIKKRAEAILSKKTPAKSKIAVSPGKKKSSLRAGKPVRAQRAVPRKESPILRRRAVQAPRRTQEILESADRTARDAHPPAKEAAHKADPSSSESNQ